MFNIPTSAFSNSDRQAGTTSIRWQESGNDDNTCQSTTNWSSSRNYTNFSNHGMNCNSSLSNNKINQQYINISNENSFDKLSSRFDQQRNYSSNISEYKDLSRFTGSSDCYLERQNGIESVVRDATHPGFSNMNNFYSFEKSSAGHGHPSSSFPIHSTHAHSILQSSQTSNCNYIHRHN